MNVFNHYSAQLNNLNFHPSEVVSRYRDSQLQVSEKLPTFVLFQSKQSNSLNAYFSFKLPFSKKAKNLTPECQIKQHMQIIIIYMYDMCIRKNFNYCYSFQVIFKS